MNGLRLFARENNLSPGAGLHRQWRVLPMAERARFASLARAENTQAKVAQQASAVNSAQSEALAGGFWGLSAPAGFPMMVNFCEAFKQGVQNLLPELPDAFDGAPEMPFPLWAPCHPDACPHRLRPEAAAAFKALQALVREVILRQGPDQQKPSEEPLVLDMSSPSTAASSQVVVAYSTRRKPIDAVLVQLKPLSLEEVPPGACVTLACEKGLDGQLPLLTDTRWCADLAAAASDWLLSTLQVAAVRQLHLFDIAATTQVERDQLNRQVEQEKETKTPMYSLRLLTGKPKPEGKKRPRANAGKGGRGRGRGAGRAPEEQSDSDGLPEAGGSSHSAVSSERSKQSEVELPAASHPRPPAMVVPPQPDAAARRPRQNVRRRQVWGTRPAFQVAPIHAGGSRVPTGWGAICGLHRDPANPGLQCKKALPAALETLACRWPEHSWVARE